MTREIRDSLNSRGILVPPKRMAKPQSRRKRAIMRVSRGRDLRWLVGSSGKREVPYYITSSNREYTSNQFYNRSLSISLNILLLNIMKLFLSFQCEASS